MHGRSVIVVRSACRFLLATAMALPLSVSQAQGKAVGVISDQRMPDMSGTDFLNIVKQLYPDTLRIILSGYTDLEVVTDSVNRGAVFKFLTKPWDDELLRTQVRDAFHRLAISGRIRTGQKTKRPHVNAKDWLYDLAQLSNDVQNCPVATDDY